LATLVAVVFSSVGLTQPIDAKLAKEEGELRWFDIRHLGVEGQGWRETAAPFDRLPAKAEGKVRKEVWGLSRQSAGLCVRFVSESPALHARWALTSANLAMPHMPATGVSGLDLYYRAADGKWKWLANGRPTKQSNSQALATGLPPGKREYLLYLPLYNGVSSVEIGIPKDAALEKAPPYPDARRKPIVFYGTSITQGGCASRPGMVHTAILSRRHGSPVINLGFSGNGRMEPELAELLAEIDAAVYVLDCLPNMNAAMVAERVDPFVRALLRAHPKTPIVLVEDRSYANSTLLSGPREGNRTNRESLKKVYDRLIADKAGGVHYIKGESLLGDDTEATVDSSHPTDLGFMRQADAFQKVIEPLLPPLNPPRAVIEGYATPLSVRPGEEVEFHVSCGDPTYRVEIARIGSERQVVWSRDGMRGTKHPIFDDASSHACRWPVSFTLTVPKEWKSGYYAARLTAKGTPKESSSELFFVVRAAEPGKDTKILLQLATNTYNAYCNWGGYSLYAFNGRNGVQGRRVSFERPITGEFARWELPFVQWAERAGYKFDYAVNEDLEFHPEILQHYKLVLSVGHDEYWSAPMRDNLEKFIANGGNLSFFSGNTCCWQVRAENEGRALVCWKQSFREDPYHKHEDHSLLSTLWSHHLVKRPENLLTGVGFLHGGYHMSHGQYMNGPGSYTIHRPEHWLFEGTNLKRGDAFGAGNAPSGGRYKVVGYECDGCELTWRDGLPFPTHRDGAPESFEVLATAPARWHADDCEWYEKWEKGREGHAVVGVYTRGGTVVTVGSTDWSHGLRGQDPNVIRITKSVLDRLSK
jgi:hypothetical protein